MEPITLAERELLRFRTAQRVVDGALALTAAAQTLELSVRQVKRLTRQLRLAGPAAFASPRRGTPANNAFDADTRERILDLARTTYAGFGPTLFAETLAQRHGVRVSREWLRQQLIVNGLWTPKRRKRKAHPLRERRPRFGELIQIDGSPHDWFEGRAPHCTLLLAIDDATSRICAARLEPIEPMR